MTFRRMARRMSSTGPLLLLLLIACTDAVPQVPGADERLALELAAARHMRARYPGDPLALDPAFQEPDHAPGWPTAGQRDSARTAALARALDARVTSDRAGGGVYLLLSEPVIRGDTATITITVAWSGAGRRGGYETQALTLVRERGAWRVVRSVQLGIT